jgi:hypothetical protein
LVKLSSGDTFLIRPMRGAGTIALLGMLPDGKLEAGQMKALVVKHYEDILEKCVMPSVVEPKLDKEDYLTTDVIELLGHVMNATGLTDEDKSKRDEFRPNPDSTDA